MASLAENLARVRKQRGLSQAALADKIGVRQNTIAAIETGESKKTRYLADLARELEVSVFDLDPGLAPAAIIPERQLMGTARDFPIFASAEGGPGEIIRSTDPVDWVPWPVPVQHVKEAYGLIVTGASMAPEFDPGDIAIVNPRYPAHGDTTCIFYSERDGEARATIKRLVRASADKWFLRQWNPPDGLKQEFTLNRKDWPVCHRVLGKYYRQ